MGNLQDFLVSGIGQITTVGVIALLFLLIMISGKNKKSNSKDLALSAILVALGTALSYITLFKMPYGGSVTPFSMLAVVLAGYLLGLKRGVMVGFCVGLLNLLFNPYVIHPVQMLLDYPFAFGALAFGAIFRNSGKFALTYAYVSGILFRYICSVLSGIIFFGANSPEGFNSVTWSLFYNITYLGSEALLTIVVINIPVIKNTFEKLKLQIENQK